MSEEIKISEYASIEEVKQAYEQQVVKGPLSILFALIEKSHFPAALDMLPLIKESLREFNVPVLELKLSEKIGDIATTNIIEVLTALNKNVVGLHELMSQIVQSQTSNMPETNT